jgi:hypothetical protein
VKLQVLTAAVPLKRRPNPTRIYGSTSQKAVIFLSHTVQTFMETCFTCQGWSCLPAWLFVAVEALWYLILHVMSASVVQCLSFLPLDPKLAGSNPVKDDGFLRTIKIRSTTSFGGEVKPTAPRRKILRHVKELCGVWKIYFVGNIRRHFSPSFSRFTTSCLYWYFPESFGGWIRMIRSQMGTHNRSQNGGSAWDALYDTTL